LAFVGCGDSDSGDNTGGGTPGTTGPISSTVPIAFTVEQYPLSAQGAVHEGQLVELSGLVLNVRYSDNSWKSVSDITRVTVDPAVYIYFPEAGPKIDGNYYDSWGYNLTYKEGAGTVTNWIPYERFGNHRKLLDLDVTGQMNKQEYLIDDIPDYSGLTVWGRYSDVLDQSTVRNLLQNENQNRSDWYRRPIPLSTDIKEHKWAWVWNADPGKGSFQPSDAPGVLISIGSYGFVSSDIKGTDNPVADWRLQGYRIELSKIHQVKKLEWAPEPSFPNTIFYDDPTLINGVELRQNDVYRSVVDKYKAMQDKWIDYAFKDAGIKVTYENDVEKTYSLLNLLTMNPYNPSALENMGYGLSWANLELYPISRNGLKIDVVRSTKQVITLEGGDGVKSGVLNWDPILYGNTVNNTPGATQETVVFDSITGVATTPGAGATVVGDGGWAQWAQLGLGNTRMRFFWRGKTLDVVVPVYNRPRSLTYTIKEGVEGPPIIMQGHNFVYWPPEGRVAFLNKLKVSVTYGRQGGTEADTKVREDIWADIGAGICRSEIVFRNAANARTTMPTLFSPTIFNWKDNSQGGDLEAMRGYYNFGQTTIVQDNEIVTQSQLRKEIADNYARGRTINGRIIYTGWAGDPEATRSVNNSATPLPIGVVGYPENP